MIHLVGMYPHARIYFRVLLGQRDQAREWIARGRQLHPNRRELADLDTRVR